MAVPRFSTHGTKPLLWFADGNYGMLRILTGQRGSLEQYLNRDFRQKSGSTQIRRGRLSFCGLHFRFDAHLICGCRECRISGEISRAAAEASLVRSAKDLKIRDLDHENYVFVGSPASNPWVSLFQDKLNFRESEEAVGKSAKAFVNTTAASRGAGAIRRPPLDWTEGADYATIDLVPNLTHDGSVLILQGLQQEGTEAAGRFLADPENCRQLQRSLGIPASDTAFQKTSGLKLSFAPVAFQARRIQPRWLPSVEFTN